MAPKKRSLKTAKLGPVVVDTNVIAYYLLGTEPFAEEAARFWRRAGEVLAPASWQAELANVVSLAARHSVLAPEEALATLDNALGLGIRSAPVHALWGRSVLRALDARVSAYDALFVELAIREGAALTTFDTVVLERFPDVARRPGALG